MKTDLEDWKIIEELRIASDPRAAATRAPLSCESGNFFSRITKTASAYERPIESIAA